MLLNYVRVRVACRLNDYVIVKRKLDSRTRYRKEKTFTMELGYRNVVYRKRSCGRSIRGLISLGSI